MLKYHRDYQATNYFTKGDEGLLYFAELLLKLKRKRDEAEAIAVLEKVTHSNNEDFCGQAKRLLAEIK